MTDPLTKQEIDRLVATCRNGDDVEVWLTEVTVARGLDPRSDLDAQKVRSILGPVSLKIPAHVAARREGDAEDGTLMPRIVNGREVELLKAELDAFQEKMSRPLPPPSMIMPESGNRQTGLAGTQGRERRIVLAAMAALGAIIALIVFSFGALFVGAWLNVFGIGKHNSGSQVRRRCGRPGRGIAGCGCSVRR